jgi:hypothetical protein
MLNSKKGPLNAAPFAGNHLTITRHELDKVACMLLAVCGLASSIPAL